MLAADCHADVLLDSINRLQRISEADRLKLDAFKLPHHGSRNNLSKDLIQKIDCTRYLFSSNGAYYKHPDKEAVARVIKYGIGIRQLIFNYSTAFNDIWDVDEWKIQYGYSLTFPDSGVSGQEIDL